MKFILFDIDGTMISSGGAGTLAMSTAFEEMFAVKNAFVSISMAGRTDAQILGEALKIHGIAVDDITVSRYFSSYLIHLETNMGKTNGHVKKGIREALEALKVSDDHVLGLLTGNIEEGARIKLRHFGLDSYFDIGAFGSDHEDRNRLLPIAVERLHAQRSIRVDFSSCVVIGDTPKDIECSKPFGALAIGVATGPYNIEALRAAGADCVFEDLSDTAGFVSSLYAGAGCLLPEA